MFTYLPRNSHYQNSVVDCVGTSFFGQFCGNEAFHKNTYELGETWAMRKKTWAMRLPFHWFYLKS